MNMGLQLAGGDGTSLKVVPFHFFVSSSTISRFGERFRGGQYSLASLLFAVLLTVPPCPLESAPLQVAQIV